MLNMSVQKQFWIVLLLVKNVAILIFFLKNTLKYNQWIEFNHKISAKTCVQAYQLSAIFRGYNPGPPLIWGGEHLPRPLPETLSPMIHGSHFGPSRFISGCATDNNKSNSTGAVRVTANLPRIHSLSLCQLNANSNKNEMRLKVYLRKTTPFDSKCLKLYFW